MRENNWSKKGFCSPMKGRKHSEEVKNHLSEIKKGTYFGGGNPKRIICINTGISFDTISEAARQMNIPRTSINDVLKKKKKNT